MSDAREQFRERLIDYVYGQLEGAELAAFEAQLAESESYRNELAELQRTLQTARAGLALLEELPPARVGRVVKAFAQAQAESARRSWYAGVWAWWRNPIWVTAVGVSAVVGLAVITHAPKQEPRERRSELPAATDYAAPEPDTRESSGAGLPVAPEAPRSAAPPARRRLQPTAAKPTAEMPLGNAVGAVAPVQPAKKERVHDDKASARSRGAPAREAEVAADVAPAALSAEPAPQSSAAPAPPALAAEPASQPSAAPAPAAHTADPAREPRPAAAGANDPEADVLLRSAREHVTAHRFADAAAVYQVLLRRFPNDARAPEWRRQRRLAARAATAVESAP